VENGAAGIGFGRAGHDHEGEKMLFARAELVVRFAIGRGDRGGWRGPPRCSRRATRRTRRRAPFQAQERRTYCESSCRCRRSGYPRRVTVRVPARSRNAPRDRVLARARVARSGYPHRARRARAVRTRRDRSPARRPLAPRCRRLPAGFGCARRARAHPARGTSARMWTGEIPSNRRSAPVRVRR